MNNLFSILEINRKSDIFLNTDNPNKLLLFLLNNTQMSVTSKVSEVFDIYKRTLLKHEKTLNYVFFISHNFVFNDELNNAKLTKDNE